MEWVIEGEYVIATPDRVLKNHAVVVEDDKIVDIGPADEINKKYRRYEKLGGRRKIVMPGLINAHTHAGMSLLRGYADDMQLYEWLTKKIWPVEAHLTPDDVYIGTLLSCVEMLRCGITAFADMYFHCEKIAEAVKKAGIRASICFAIIETVMKDVDAALREGVNVVKKIHGTADGRVTAMLGPHAPYTCSPDTLMRVREIANDLNVGIHIHVAETREEKQQIEKSFDVKLGEKGVVEYLDSIGFLGPDVLAAHVVWVSDKEIEILKERDVNVAHNPVSNMKLASGVSPVPDMLKRGVNVALATDGPVSNNCLDIFEEMKVAALLHKVSNLDPTTVPAIEALRMATTNGARALLLEKDIGTLEVGKKADVIILDFRKPRLTPLHNVISHIVYAARGEDVESVMVNGKLLMEHGEIKVLNVDEVMEKAEKAAYDLLSRASG
ncbi:MAG: amidohydrolase [Candidatus Baldrarchaeia archaeon]